MKYIYKIFLFTILLILQLAAHAQQATPKNFMYGNGKIYVVMAVVILIVAGLFAYLINIDRKITKLEREKE